MTRDEYVESVGKLATELVEKLGPTDAFTVWNKVIYQTVTIMIKDMEDYCKDHPVGEEDELEETLSRKCARSIPLYADTFILARTTLLDGDDRFEKEGALLPVVIETIHKLFYIIGKMNQETGKVPEVPYMKSIDDVGMIGKFLSEDPLKINIKRM